MRTPTRAALGRSLAVALRLVFGAATLSACQSAVHTAPEPVATSLIVRNPGVFDVNVYALSGANANPTWLGTISAGRTGSLPVPASAVGSARMLVVQARALGATTSWTSESVSVADGRVPLLELVANGAGNCAGSALYSVTTIDVEEFLR